MKPKSSIKAESQSVGTSRVAELPEVLLAVKSHSQEFTDKLLSAAANGWSGHLRFNLKIERGRVITAQISTDNIQMVNYPDDDTVKST